ncbi:GFA family protein [Sphingopyxis panaciterrulae]|uniref:CENP-V/GFA domain-containing protein n=1 Tax=Sphingopyxis panaciterrulae TaxID=462372 RepID=A0A7W9ESW0_9SPHN|nr:GFA family protein [Sphingopyxis panaciterrulae]MBB5707580.1 hypothetical protein [Sphingopyxis panaciterrulae]
MKRIKTQVSGGCQCGAVRYHASAMLDNAHLCHCRMCQKAVGNLFAALVAAPRDALVWTRGEPAVFHSSTHVARGFCRDCGTPLFFDYVEGERVNLTIGSLDEPARFPPVGQVGIEARMPWLGGLAALPGDRTTEETAPDDAAAIRANNRQHPDHDTENWPVGGRRKKPGTSR